MLLTQRELRASFELVEAGDHIVGYFREIGLETMKRYFTSAPPSDVQWRTARDEAAKMKREQRVTKLAATARAIKAQPAVNSGKPRASKPLEHLDLLAELTDQLFSRPEVVAVIFAQTTCSIDALLDSFTG